MGMTSLQQLQPSLTRLLKSLPPSPSQGKLDELVKKTLSDTQAKSSAENRKSQWDYLLKNAVFDLAVRSSLRSQINPTQRLEYRGEGPQG